MKRKSKMTYHKPIKQEKMELFNDEMKELGFNTQQRKEELSLLRKCDTEEEYIRASRAGFTKKLNRKERKKVYELYDLWVK